jgi:ribose-phosphate pyrophosphokinase
MKQGARSVMSVCTHAVLSGQAAQKIHESPLELLVLSDTIPLGEKEKKTNKLRVLSVGKLLGEAIRRIHTGDSVSSLFV